MRVDKSPSYEAARDACEAIEEEVIALLEKKARYYILPLGVSVLSVATGVLFTYSLWGGRLLNNLMVHADEAQTRRSSRAGAATSCPALPSSRTCY